MIYIEPLQLYTKSSVRLAHSPNIRLRCNKACLRCWFWKQCYV